MRYGRASVLAGLLAGCAALAAQQAQPPASPPPQSSAPTAGAAAAGSAPAASPAAAPGSTQTPEQEKGTSQAGEAPQAVRAPKIPRAKVPAAAWEMLSDAVDSDKLRTRSDVAAALTVMENDHRSVAALERLLSDKDETIRVMAVNSLGGIPARAAIPALQRSLDDSSAQVRFAAAQVLWKMGDRSGRDILYGVLDGEMKTKPGFVKSHIDEAKKDAHDPKALALIGINQVSGEFLGPFSMGVSMIEEYAKKNSAPVQALCLQLLSTDRSAETLDEVKDVLNNENWAVRAAAARAVARLGLREEIPDLANMMQYDKSEAARLMAAAAILRLQPMVRRTPVAAPSAQVQASLNQNVNQGVNRAQAVQVAAGGNQR